MLTSFWYKVLHRKYLNCDTCSTVTLSRDILTKTMYVSLKVIVFVFAPDIFILNSLPTLLRLIFASRLTLWLIKFDHMQIS